MEKTRKTKVIAILALVVAVVGMSLGFAAFSNILTISSSATVTPNEDDFKMVVYGLAENFSDKSDVADLLDISYYTSTDISVPYTKYNSISATNALINKTSKNIKLENLSVNFTNPGDNVVYLFAIKNEGKYDAFINFADYEAFFTVGVQKECTPEEEATPALVEAACNEIKVSLVPFSSSGEILSNISGFSLSSSYKISSNNYIFFIVEVSYSGVDVRADGNFSVDFEDVEMEFTSVAKGTILNP